MTSKFKVIALTALIGAGLVSETAAGSRAVECYERYRTPATYETVHENIVVNRASRRVDRIAAIYGTRKRAVLVSPQQVSYEIVPARYTTQYHKVKISDGGYSWEWRIIDGRKVLCKIKHRARYQSVGERVLVREAYKRQIVIPAEYAYEVEQVLIQPEQTRVVDIPASYQTVARIVLVDEGTSGWRRVRIPKHCGG